MDTVTLPFTEWLPDQAPIDIGGINDVENVYSRANGYSPWRDLVDFSNALSTRCIGGLATRDSDGSVNLFSGTATRLYSLNTTASTWTDVSKSASDYAVPSLEFWGMGQFGANIIAVNLANNPQKFVLGSSSEFADLGGSPPKARHIGIVRDFVVLGNTDNATNEVHWSGFNNSESWTVGTSQSDRQSFPDSGQVQAVVGGEVGYVILETSIRRMTYVGGDIIFQFDEIERDRGTQSPKSVVRYGAGFFYFGRDGFYYFNGQASEPIGSDKVDAWFLAHADPGYLQSIVGAYDPIRRLVIWTFISTSSPGTHDMMIAYSITSRRWTKITQPVEFLLQTVSTGYTLEGLDAISSSIDALGNSLDSPVYVGGALAFTGFGTDHIAGQFNGAPLAATVATQEKNQYQGGFLFLNAAIPIVDSTAAQVAIGSRSRFGDSISYSAASSMQANGVCPLRARGRMFFGEMTIPAGSEWTFAEGITFSMRADGMR